MELKKEVLKRMTDVAKKKKPIAIRSIDPAVLEVLAWELPVDTAYDRYLSRQPQCKFGDTGICLPDLYPRSLPYYT